jgi:RNA polymerase sigma factor (TIGR02999 family)
MGRLRLTTGLLHGRATHPLSVVRYMAMKNEDDAGPPQTGAGQEYLDQVVPDLYAELRLLAHQRLRRSPLERSLNTTGLVHEAYLRLVRSGHTPFQNHDHFLATSSRVMRNVLVDHARARTAAKRGDGVALELLHEETWVADVDLDRVMELNEALLRLEQLDEGRHGWWNSGTSVDSPSKRSPPPWASPSPP